MYNKFIKYIYIIHVSMNLFHLIANPTVEGDSEGAGDFAVVCVSD
ncbi:hypothetical protein QFZ77_003098 [Paenibacillus sp. V4I3]|nr:hypothetical protein [Paenibacillus sp. V4I3]